MSFVHQARTKERKVSKQKNRKGEKTYHILKVAIQRLHEKVNQLEDAQLILSGG